MPQTNHWERRTKPDRAPRKGFEGQEGCAGQATPPLLEGAVVLVGDGKISSPFFTTEGTFATFPIATKPPRQHPQPPVSMVEEWDNPAMTEFKRQEAEERVAFAQSHTQEEWLAALEHSSMRDESIRLAPKRLRQLPFKPIKLPW